MDVLREMLAAAVEEPCPRRCDAEISRLRARAEKAEAENAGLRAELATIREERIASAHSWRCPGCGASGASRHEVSAACRCKAGVSP